MKSYIIILSILLLCQCSDTIVSGGSEDEAVGIINDSDDIWQESLLDSLSQNSKNYHQVIISDTSDEILRHSFIIQDTDFIEERVLYYFEWQNINDFDNPPFGGLFSELKKLTLDIGEINLVTFSYVTFHSKNNLIFTKNEFDDVYVQTQAGSVYCVSYANGEIKNYQICNFGDLIRRIHG